MLPLEREMKYLQCVQSEKKNKKTQFTFLEIFI